MCTAEIRTLRATARVVISVAKRMKEDLLLLVVGVVVIPLLPVILVGAVIAGVWGRIKRRRLRRRFEASWGARGRRAVFVYSNSPHWKERIEREILPRIADRVVVLNWSERSTDEWRQRPTEVRIFESWGGTREFNPLAVVFHPGEPVKVIRFWQAYRDFKHGKPRLLRQAESELFQALGLPTEVRPEA
jgi:hypothetical protein